MAETRFRTLSRTQARAAYDRIGSLQDRQTFYESHALADLCEHADFEHAASVFEFGCGTGRFGAELLRERLPKDAHYLGVDQSSTMVGLARERMLPFGERAEIRQTDGSTGLAVADASYDRFVSSYVLDLLGFDDIRQLLREAHRALEPRGLLCLTSLTAAESSLSRAVMWGWHQVNRVSPALLGGCRPLELLNHISPEHWQVVHHRRIEAFGIPSEIVVAKPLRGETSAG
jgi:ubiquinone/menaquinone biosynthesis C-methylase UbiE